MAAKWFNSLDTNSSRHKKIIKFAICVKLWQHNFTIAAVVKFLTKGLCLESGLHSLPSRRSRCPRSSQLKVSRKLVKRRQNHEVKSSTIRLIYQIKYYDLCKGYSIILLNNVFFQIKYVHSWYPIKYKYFNDTCLIADIFFWFFWYTKLIVVGKL